MLWKLWAYVSPFNERAAILFSSFLSNIALGSAAAFWEYLFDPVRVKTQ
jgi:hypothetical protein